MVHPSKISIKNTLFFSNGAYDSSPIIGIYCGKNIPKQIPSHTNNLFLKFHSDNALNKKGFKIFWDGTTTGCGGILTSPSGQIASPNYPQTYGANAMCFWKISTSAGSVLNLMFLDLHLEEHLLCRLDYVEVSLLLLKFHLSLIFLDLLRYMTASTFNQNH